MRLLAAGLAIWIAHSPPQLGSPLEGLKLSDLRDTFTEVHNGHPHEAIDIIAPRGTPVHAVVSGTIRKLFISKPGGNTIYEFDESGSRSYYYAHLDRYAAGLREGMHVRRGDVIGYVGSTGNALKPHLHFTVFELGSNQEWWLGKPINPYSDLVRAVKKHQPYDQ
jgi:peptidoglycan LD-endopeptidase LytH